MVVGVSTMWLPQVAGGLRGEEAAVVPVKLRGGDGQPCIPGAGEGGEHGAMVVGHASHTHCQGACARTAPIICGPLTPTVGPWFPGHILCLCCPAYAREMCCCMHTDRPSHACVQQVS